MFVGALAGSIPLRQFMSPRTMVRLVGVTGFARLALGQARPQRPGAWRSCSARSLSRPSISGFPDVPGQLGRKRSCVACRRVTRCRRTSSLPTISARRLP